MMPKPWDPAHNIELLDAMARKAAAEGAELLVTRERFLDGQRFHAAVPDILVKD